MKIGYPFDSTIVSANYFDARRKVWAIKILLLYQIRTSAWQKFWSLNFIFFLNVKCILTRMTLITRDMNLHIIINWFCMEMDLSLNWKFVAYSWFHRILYHRWKIHFNRNIYFYFSSFCFHHVIIVLFNNISVHRWVSFVNALTLTKVPKVIKDAK